LGLTRTGKQPFSVEILTVKSWALQHVSNQKLQVKEHHTKEFRTLETLVE
jgi:hypothetical protein